MITRVKFRGFRCLSDLDMDLNPLTVFVGPNGCGKTTVLQGVHLASQLGLPHPNERRHINHRLGLLFSGPLDPQRLVTPGASGFTLQLRDGSSALSLGVEPTASHEGGIRFTVEASDSTPPRLVLPDDLMSAASFLNSDAIRHFGSAVFLRLDASILAAPSVSDDEVPRIEYDGAGLASVLAYLAGAAPEVKSAIEADLRAVVPQARGIRTFPARVRRLGTRPFSVGDQVVQVPEEQWINGHRFSVEMVGGGMVPADLLSEGTVLTLGLLTVLHSPECPRTVLLDDVDKGLHMGAQFRLIQAIRRLQERRPSTQILCTSHSPFLFEGIEGQEVRVMALDAQGHSHAKPLTAHPEYARWRKIMNTGEIWGSLGEDWVVNGQ